MKAVAVFLLLCGLVAQYFELFQSDSTREIRDAKAHVLAINYATYRNAAHQYIHHHQDEIRDGDIASVSFEKWIPNGWIPMRDWKVRVENQICYVYGRAEPDEIDAVRKLYRGSFALGRSEDGHLVPAHGGMMPVPDWIPEGSMLSMTEVRP